MNVTKTSPPPSLSLDTHATDIRDIKPPVEIASGWEWLWLALGALALIAQPKPFCIAVSDAARQYLEERFEFRAPERTTEEFLYELQRTDLLTRDQKDSLGEFLQSCDLVKFAKYEPREPELHDLHGCALRLVEETEPQPTPLTAGPDHAARGTQHETADTDSQP